jgi:hypothetical protein
MRGVKESVKSVAPPHKSRDLARSLVASEADASTTVFHTKPATARVYERLRRQLSAPVGVDGFQVLASRALALAKSQSPRLGEVQVTASGELCGLGEVELQKDASAGEDNEAGVILIAQLLGLFLTLLGEATTLRLIEDLRLQVDVETELVATTEGATALTVDRTQTSAAFEDLLLEINRLRSVSDHIEALACKHSDMEEGLASIVGNIRNIAVVLDIFTLIRSNAGGPQEEVPSLQKNRYMN